MAINIISNPNSVVSAFNQMAFNVSSTQAGQSNFNFIADVYVSGINTAVSRIAIPKQPSVNTCLIDAMIYSGEAVEILQSTVEQFRLMGYVKSIILPETNEI